MAGASSSLLKATMAKAFQEDHHLPSNNPCHLPSLKFPFLWGGLEKRHKLSRHGEHKITPASAEAVVIVPEKQQKHGMDLWSPLANEAVRRLLPRLFRVARLRLTPKSWTAIFEILVEKGVIGCQSFTLIGVAGSLVGSVLCFVEGCFAVLESFVQYFRAMSHMVDQGEIVKLLIEALDMFLVGTAVLTFGMGLYTMFARSTENRKERGLQIAESNLGLFSLNKLKDGMRIHSITQAKTRIGHAVLLLLQAGILEKFKNVPLASGLDMACFAGAVFLSSACVFLLSKLTMQQHCRQPCI